MDATAYLTRHGWRGKGYSLHPDRGISKPLLVSRKNNSLGLGKKEHDAQADQWWLRSFDSALKALPTEQQARSNVPRKPIPQIKPTKWTANGGLYGRFVRGDGLKGTLNDLNGKEATGKDEGGSNVSVIKLKEKKRKHKKKDSKTGLETPPFSASSTHSDATETECPRPVEKKHKKQKRDSIAVDETDSGSTKPTKKYKKSKKEKYPSRQNEKKVDTEPEGLELVKKHKKEKKEKKHEDKGRTKGLDSSENPLTLPKLPDTKRQQSSHQKSKSRSQGASGYATPVSLNTECNSKARKKSKKRKRDIEKA
ncbi:MAG: hypothetical protein M1834_005718 [Cirrosporium novae-zelandiae]|nr:MAG: hypothetical protein M1834_005718 [Cirrosporium novae-zelandiae]